MLCGLASAGSLRFRPKAEDRDDTFDFAVTLADGEELEPGMKMTFDARSATWSFPAAGGSSVKVKAEIWKDIRREPVSF